MIYTPEMTLRDARALYFRLNNFGDDGGYAERWIKVKVWQVPIWIPNTEGRRRAVKLHDLHHVLTEYPTTWRGEAEISAWEIGAGGLHRYYAGWWLDIMNVAQGLVVNPLGVYRGFMRGRNTSNLYSLQFTDEILDHCVDEYRRCLSLDRVSESAGIADHLLFVCWIFISVTVYIASVLGAISPLILIVLWILWR
jgi:hypothetical protein